MHACNVTHTLFGYWLLILPVSSIVAPSYQLEIGSNYVIPELRQVLFNKPVMQGSILVNQATTGTYQELWFNVPLDGTSNAYEIDIAVGYSSSAGQRHRVVTEVRYINLASPSLSDVSLESNLLSVKLAYYQAISNRTTFNAEYYTIRGLTDNQVLSLSLSRRFTPSDIDVDVTTGLSCVDADESVGWFQFIRIPRIISSDDALRFRIFADRLSLSHPPSINASYQWRW